MTIERKGLTATLKGNIDALKFQNGKLKDEKKKLTDQLKERELELMHAHKSILELQSLNDSLKIAGSLSITEEDKKLNRKKLSDLVRKIDNCIALLNQQ